MSSYKVVLRIAKARKPNSGDEMFVKDCIQDICLEVLSEAAATKVSKVFNLSDSENKTIQLINSV